jgi:hypothetical protein
LLAFPKPKDAKRPPKPAVKVYPSGREVCSKSKAGRDEYRRRVQTMWQRQGGRRGLQISEYCKSVGGFMRLEESTFEHVDGRGGGKRDDRIEKDGKPYNLAACGICNFLKGSRKLEHLNN